MEEKPNYCCKSDNGEKSEKSQGLSRFSRCSQLVLLTDGMGRVFDQKASGVTRSFAWATGKGQKFYWKAESETEQVWDQDFSLGHESLKWLWDTRSRQLDNNPRVPGRGPSWRHAFESDQHTQLDLMICRFYIHELAYLPHLLGRPKSILAGLLRHLQVCVGLQKIWATEMRVPGQGWTRLRSHFLFQLSCCKQASFLRSI